MHMQKHTRRKSFICCKFFWISEIPKHNSHKLRICGAWRVCRHHAAAGFPINSNICSCDTWCGNTPPSKWKASSCGRKGVYACACAHMCQVSWFTICLDVHAWHQSMNFELDWQKLSTLTKFSVSSLGTVMPKMRNKCESCNCITHNLLFTYSQGDLGESEVTVRIYQSMRICAA